MLCYDPYCLACEGRVLAVVEPAQTDAVRTAWQSLPEGRDAAVIGRILRRGGAEVSLRTELGGERFLEELEDDPLPRIC
jgi:hydrogenase expression/formation protein HypE